MVGWWCLLFSRAFTHSAEQETRTHTHTSLYTDLHYWKWWVAGGFSHLLFLLGSSRAARDANILLAQWLRGLSMWTVWKCGLFADSTLGGQIPHRVVALLPSPSLDICTIGDPVHPAEKQLVLKKWQPAYRWQGHGGGEQKEKKRKKGTMRRLKKGTGEGAASSGCGKWHNFLETSKVKY